MKEDNNIGVYKINFLKLTKHYEKRRDYWDFIMKMIN